jgi:hypothetical protein
VAAGGVNHFVRQATSRGASLAGFPEDERREWEQFWADVDALLARLDAAK